MALLSQDSLSAFKQSTDILKQQAKDITQAQTGKIKTETGTTEEAMPGYGELVAKITEQKAQAPIIQAEVQQKQLAQQQQTSQANMQLKQQSLTAKENIKNQTEELLQKFEQQKDLLNLDRYKSELEQIGFGLRMQNAKYIDQLKLEGARARLDQKSRMTEALSATILQDELDLLKNNLAFKKMMGIEELKVKGAMAADDRVFREELANLDIETALAVAMADSDARNSALKWESVADVVQTVGKLATNKALADKEKKDKLKEQKQSVLDTTT